MKLKRQHKEIIASISWGVLGWSGFLTTMEVFGAICGILWLWTFMAVMMFTISHDTSENKPLEVKNNENII